MKLRAWRSNQDESQGRGRCSGAVMESQTEDQLGLAAVNRSAVGQAQAMLMGRFSMDANRAFSLW